MLSIHDAQESGFDFRSVMLYRPTVIFNTTDTTNKILSSNICN